MATLPLWVPTVDRVEPSNWTRFARQLVADGRAPAPVATDPWALHRWSIDHPGPFWTAVWELTRCPGDPGPLGPYDAGIATAPSTFPEAELNVAEVLLGEPSDDEALVVVDETGARAAVTRRELRERVRLAAGALAADGVGPGDTVVAVLPNAIEIAVAGLATAAIGAAFASASPDFGTEALVDRFGQLQPAVLVCSGRHRYGGKAHDTVGRAVALADALGVRRAVMTGAEPPASSAGGPAWLPWDGWLGAAEPIASFERFGFDHPWYVLFSSGTTGTPKAIVHRTGGALLKHTTEQVLHSDIRPGDVLFQYTTTGWMMWNWALSGLGTGATVLSYDGSPFQPGPTALWDLAEREGVTFFGTSARYLDECARLGLEPAATHELGRLRTISSTGSPLSTDRFTWVYEAVAGDVHLASISGGTDLCGCLVGGYPTLPVHAGEIQGPVLGVAADVVDDTGRPVRGTQGELAVDRPFPSQPLGFVGDTDGRRYRSSYYEEIPGHWHQGDRATRTEAGGFVIHGRSDATLNPGGVRIGTAEIYRTVERHPAVAESIAVPRHIRDGAVDDQVIVLFVRLHEGRVLDDDLAAELRASIRAELSPRHVPAAIGQVEQMPRTRSGKLVEIAVRTVVNGGKVADTGALEDAAVLDQFVDHPCLADLPGR